MSTQTWNNFFVKIPCYQLPIFYTFSLGCSGPGIISCEATIEPTESSEQTEPTKTNISSKTTTEPTDSTKQTEPCGKNIGQASLPLWNIIIMVLVLLLFVLAWPAESTEITGPTELTNHTETTKPTEHTESTKQPWSAELTKYFQINNKQ